MSKKTNKIEYKTTLNLPQTNFPMKANLVQRELTNLKFWSKIDLYVKMQKLRVNAPKFILNDGPPYANGDIHIGHALNKILKDIIVKFKHLSGYQVPYVPGWDCHGLPIELQVEKKDWKPNDKIDVKTFRQKCRAYAKKQIEVQRKSFIRLGVVGDWYNPYVTMDYTFEANIIRTFGKIIANGHLQRGNKPVHWCINCTSALAEAEVEYDNKVSPSIDVGFLVTDPVSVLHCFNKSVAHNERLQIYVVIWTTTPWTLPANQAVAVHAELPYVLVQSGENRFIIAKELVKHVMKRIGSEKHCVLGQCIGKDLEHQILQHPFYERTVPIILAKHVNVDTGTGCIHTAPAHGYEDYNACKLYNLPIKNLVDANGQFIKGTPFVEGVTIFKANDTLITLLKKRKVLLAHNEITHSYPHCWRHKTPLIFRTTPQWFVSMENQGLRASTLKVIQKVKWLPAWGQARIKAMVNTRPDWCISRQRVWGTPITLFVHKQNGQIHPNTPQLIEKVALKVERGGIDVWHEMNPTDLLGDEHPNYEKVQDTLDVWFDSGAIHACVAEVHPELTDPVDLYLEGSDQHRGWFQTSLLSSVAVKQRAPYKQVLTHGFVVDANGRKMSKSLGNVVNPSQIMKTLGADILRLWVSSTDYRGELHISNEILKHTSSAYRRIRNTARFLLANLYDFTPITDCVAAENWLPLDHWIIDRARQLQIVILQAYHDYQFHIVYQNIHNFCVDDLGSFYLVIIKDRQYTCKRTDIPRRSAQTAIYYVLQAFVRWIAPILSFTAEEIWQHMPGKKEESVFLIEWFQELKELPADTLMNDIFWQQIISVRSAVNKVLESARNTRLIGSTLEAEITLYCNKALFNQLTLLENELRFILLTSKANILPLNKAPKNIYTTDITGLLIAINCSKHIKCERCWHRTPDVNQVNNFPNICKRCITNLQTGEQRTYA